MQMKRISTFWLVLCALLALPFSGSAQGVTKTLFDFQQNNLGLTVGTSASQDGNLSGRDIVNGDVTMRATSSGTMHARYYYLASRGNQLQVIKDGRLRFTAAEGKVITKVEFVLSTTQIHWSVDLGGGTLSADMKTWEGAATSVRFLGTGTNYIDSIYVTTATVVTPQADQFTEVSSLAELNALADGTLARLTLSNAQVTARGIDGWTVYVQDATAAAHFYLMDDDLQAGDVLNGTIEVTKYTQTGNPRIGPAEYTTFDGLTVTKAEAEPLAGSIADIKTAANLNRLVKISGVKFDVESKTKGTATDAEGNSIVVFNGTSGMSPYAIKEDLSSCAKATIVGILYNVSAGLQIYPLSIEEEPTVFDFSNSTLCGYAGTALTDTKGYIYNEVFTVDGVAMQVLAGSAPSRLTYANNRDTCLVMYKDYPSLKFTAPAGKAITKIEFTQAGSGNLNLTTDNGTVSDHTWQGNADGVRFLASGTVYLKNAVVTLANKGDDTYALPDIEYTEVSNIAAFNALQDGTYAKLTLTDAEVIGKSADGYSTVFIQDATGGAWIQYTSLNDQLTEQTKVSGTVYAAKRVASGNPQLKETEATPASELTAAAISDYATVEGTIAQVNVAANLNKVVRITGASFVATSATAGTLKLGDDEITVNNGTATANQQLHKIDATWVKEETKMENVTIVAILVAASATKNQLLPISMEEVAAPFDVEVASIAEFNAVEDGKLVKLSLNNARVNAYNDLQNAYYVEDATAATVIKGVNLTAGTALNGYLLGTKATEDVDYVNTPSQGYEYSMTVTDASNIVATATELVGTPMTIAEACAQATYGKLVTLSNVAIAPIGNGRNLMLTDAEGNTMKTRDLLGVLPFDYEWPANAKTITGVVLYYMTGWFLIPISASAIVEDTTVGVRAATVQTAAAPVYNIQGIRQSSLHKGINIVGGKKIAVK